MSSKAKKPAPVLGKKVKKDTTAEDIMKSEVCDTPAIIEDKEAEAPFKTTDIPKPKTISITEFLANIH